MTNPFEKIGKITQQKGYLKEEESEAGPVGQIHSKGGVLKTSQDTREHPLAYPHATAHLPAIILSWHGNYLHDQKSGTQERSSYSLARSYTSCTAFSG